MRGLSQEVVELGHQVHGAVHQRVATAHVGADADQVAGVRVGGEQAAHLASGFAVLWCGHTLHQPGHAAENVDRWVVASAGQRAAEDDVPIEGRPRDVGDRFVHILAVHQHGVDRGDTPALGWPSAFHQVGEQAEDGWRVAFGCRRFARGKADLALGHRHAGQTVEEKHDVEPLGAVGLGDGRRRARGAEAHRRRVVAGRSDHHAVLQGLNAKVMFDEVAHLTAAFADEGDDRDVRLGAARQHPQEGRLADARSGEDADPLPASEREEAVDRAHAAGHGLGDRLAVQRVWGLRVAGHPLHSAQFAAAVDWPPKSVNDSAKERPPNRGRWPTPGANDARARRHAAAVEHCKMRGAASGPDALGGQQAARRVFDKRQFA